MSYVPNSCAHTGLQAYMSLLILIYDVPDDLRPQRKYNNHRDSRLQRMCEALVLDLSCFVRARYETSRQQNPIATSRYIKWHGVGFELGIFLNFLTPEIHAEILKKS